MAADVSIETLSDIVDRLRADVDKLFDQIGGEHSDSPGLKDQLEEVAADVRRLRVLIDGDKDLGVAGLRHEFAALNRQIEELKAERREEVRDLSAKIDTIVESRQRERNERAGFMKAIRLLNKFSGAAWLPVLGYLLAQMLGVPIPGT